MRSSLALVFCLLCGTSLGQKDTLSRAQADSLGLQATVALYPSRVDLGRPYQAIVVLQYPSIYTVALPDSLTGYPGWEWMGQRHVHARSGATVTDSLVLQLRTWEIDPVQYVQPQVWVQRGTDSLLWLPQPDSAAFATRIPAYNPALPLRPDYTLIPIKTPVNWAMWAGLGAVLLVLLSAAGGLLYKPFLRWQARRRLRQRFADLKATLALQYQRVEASPVEGLNGLNDAWKQWLEDHWQVPLRSLTPREFSRLVSEREDLSEEMRALLYDLVHVEERINYAGEPLRTAWLQKAYPDLLRMLEAALLERLTAIR